MLKSIVKILKDVLTALKTEWLFVAGTTCLIFTWWLGKTLIEGEESYFKYFNGETTEYFQKMNEMRHTLTNYNVVMLNKNSIDSGRKRTREELRVTMELAFTTNNYIHAAHVRGVGDPDSIYTWNQIKVAKQLYDCGFKEDLPKASHLLDSLTQEFGNSKQIENQLEPELQAMHKVEEHHNNLVIYNRFSLWGYILGTLLIGFNNYRKFLKKQQPLKVDFSAINHKLNEIHADIKKKENKK